ncbi:hypothetical protein DEM27_33055 [Metarhizobium album]|uniref:Uncharacterized protein n=1 Tax=Metarhizobium album TaxID=2182425 RepID=A0A2U2DFF4_9HYPH|nr:hypothetical protein [Rhizobium album]PWE52047.1 hypothetical protein DEM27_33055 [Rhizobium album]
MSKTRIEIAVETLEGIDGCPVCNAWQAETDSGPERIFRNPDDVYAVRFDCGAEFSVSDDGEIDSRIPCTQITKEAAAKLDQEAIEEFEAQEDAE